MPRLETTATYSPHEEPLPAQHGPPSPSPSSAPSSQPEHVTVPSGKEAAAAIVRRMTQQERHGLSHFAQAVSEMSTGAVDVLDRDLQELSLAESTRRPPAVALLGGWHRQSVLGLSTRPGRESMQEPESGEEMMQRQTTLTFDGPMDAEEKKRRRAHFADALDVEDGGSDKLDRDSRRSGSGSDDDDDETNPSRHAVERIAHPIVRVVHVLAATFVLVTLLAFLFPMAINQVYLAITNQQAKHAGAMAVSFVATQWASFSSELTARVPSVTSAQWYLETAFTHNHTGGNILTGDFFASVIGLTCETTAVKLVATYVVPVRNVGDPWACYIQSNRTTVHGNMTNFTVAPTNDGNLSTTGSISCQEGTRACELFARSSPSEVRRSIESGFFGSINLSSSDPAVISANMEDFYQRAGPSKASLFLTPLDVVNAIFGAVSHNNFVFFSVAREALFSTLFSTDIVTDGLSSSSVVSPLRLTRTHMVMIDEDNEIIPIASTTAQTIAQLTAEKEAIKDVVKSACLSSKGIQTTSKMQFVFQLQHVSKTGTGGYTIALRGPPRDVAEGGDFDSSTSVSNVCGEVCQVSDFKTLQPSGAGIMDRDREGPLHPRCPTNVFGQRFLIVSSAEYLQDSIENVNKFVTTLGWVALAADVLMHFLLFCTLVVPLHYLRHRAINVLLDEGQPKFSRLRHMLIVATRNIWIDELKELAQTQFAQFYKFEEHRKFLPGPIRRRQRGTNLTVLMAQVEEDQRAYITRELDPATGEPYGTAALADGLPALDGSDTAGTSMGFSHPAYPFDSSAPSGASSFVGKEMKEMREGTSSHSGDPRGSAKNDELSLTSGHTSNQVSPAGPGGRTLETVSTESLERQHIDEFDGARFGVTSATVGPSAPIVPHHHPADDAFSDDAGLSSVGQHPHPPPVVSAVNTATTASAARPSSPPPLVALPVFDGMHGSDPSERSRSNTVVQMGGAHTHAATGELRTVESAALLVVSFGFLEDAYVEDPGQAGQAHRKIFADLLSVVRRYKGDPFIRTAKAVAVAWNAFEACNSPVQVAVQCAVEVHDRLVAPLRLRGFKVGLAVHVGPAVCGFMGDSDAMCSVLVGQALTTTISLAELHQNLREASMLITDPVRVAVSIFFKCVLVDVVGSGTEAGRGAMTTNVFDVRPLPADPEADRESFVVPYTTAFAMFRQHEFAGALDVLQPVLLDSAVTDVAEQRLGRRLQRLCRHYGADPEGLPRPYLRRFPAWKMHERDAMEHLRQLAAQQEAADLASFTGRPTALQAPTVSAHDAMMATPLALAQDLAAAGRRLPTPERGTSTIFSGTEATSVPLSGMLGTPGGLLNSGTQVAGSNTANFKAELEQAVQRQKHQRTPSEGTFSVPDSPAMTQVPAGLSLHGVDSDAGGSQGFERASQSWTGVRNSAPGFETDPSCPLHGSLGLAGLMSASMVCAPSPIRAGRQATSGSITTAGSGSGGQQTSQNSQPLVSRLDEQPTSGSAVREISKDHASSASSVKTPHRSAVNSVHVEPMTPMTPGMDQQHSRGSSGSHQTPFLGTEKDGRKVPSFTAALERRGSPAGEKPVPAIVTPGDGPPSDVPSRTDTPRSRPPLAPPSPAVARPSGVTFDQAATTPKGRSSHELPFGGTSLAGISPKRGASSPSTDAWDGLARTAGSRPAPQSLPHRSAAPPATQDAMWGALAQTATSGAVPAQSAAHGQSVLGAVSQSMTRQQIADTLCHWGPVSKAESKCAGRAVVAQRKARRMTKSKSVEHDPPSATPILSREATDVISATTLEHTEIPEAKGVGRPWRARPETKLSLSPEPSPRAGTARPGGDHQHDAVTLGSPLTHTETATATTAEATVSNSHSQQSGQSSRQRLRPPPIETGRSPRRDEHRASLSGSVKAPESALSLMTLGGTGTGVPSSTTVFPSSATTGIPTSSLTLIQTLTSSLGAGSPGRHAGSSHDHVSGSSPTPSGGHSAPKDRQRQRRFSAAADSTHIPGPLMEQFVPAPVEHNGHNGDDDHDATDTISAPTLSEFGRQSRSTQPPLNSPGVASAMDPARLSVFVGRDTDLASSLVQQSMRSQAQPSQSQVSTAEPGRRISVTETVTQAVGPAALDSSLLRGPDGPFELIPEGKLTEDEFTADCYEGNASFELIPEGKLTGDEFSHDGSDGGNGGLRATGDDDSDSRPDPEDELPVSFVSNTGAVYQRSAKQLGRGSYGIVYMGMEQRTGRLVALKFMPLPTDSDAIENVANEVSIMEQVHDANVVDYYGFAIAESNIVLIMECVVAGSLHSLLQSFSQVPQVTTVNFMRNILHGLHKLHAMGIMHRDVKPQNVLVTTNGQCKLTDFGASAMLSAMARDGTGVGVGGEGKGGVMGTPLYLSPEAARGQATFKSDIWAVGIMFLQLTTGDVPYVLQAQDGVGINIVQFVAGIGAGSITPQYNPMALSAVARGFVAACLRPEPDARPSADELLQMPLFLV